MATREEVLLAKAVIDRVNSIINRVHNCELGVSSEIGLLEGLLDDTARKQKIITGLQAYGVDVLALKAEINTVKDIVAYIRNNKPAAVQH